MHIYMSLSPSSSVAIAALAMNQARAGRPDDDGCTLCAAGVRRSDLLRPVPTERVHLTDAA